MSFHRFPPGGLRRNTKAAAGIEAAAIAPTVMIMMLMFLDVSKAYREQTQIIAAVAAGAQFAYLGAQAGTAPATIISGTTSEVVAAANALLARSDVAISVNNNPVTAATTAAQLYNYWAQSCCLSGGSGSAVSYTCSSSMTICADGSDPGVYLSISASVSFSPFFPMDTQIAGKTLYNRIITRVQ